MNTVYQQYGNTMEQAVAGFSKPDFKCEAHLIGQIQGGKHFETDDGLFCEMAIDCGQGWNLLQPGSNKGLQTQTSYASPGQLFVWNQPFDLHFEIQNLQGWPKALIKVWRLDPSNKIDACSYGTVQFPRTAGFHEIICETWTPTGENIDVQGRHNGEMLEKIDKQARFDRSLDWRYQALSFYMENPPRLTTLAPLTTDKGDFSRRKILNSVSNGQVIIEVEIILKNFKRLGISGQ
ncbi:hypothetical protein pb186bvf_015416 [Paramecium bursaria]